MPTPPLYTPGPTPPAVMRSIMARYHADMQAQVDHTLADLAGRWQGVQANLATTITRLERQMTAAKNAGDTITYSWLSQERRLLDLKTAVAGDVARFAQGARQIIGDAQLAAVTNGTQAAQAAMAAAMSGVGGQPIGHTFGVVPEDVLHQIAGATQPYSPLSSLFDQFGADASAAAQAALFQSVALGEGAKVAAQRLVYATNMSAQRAEVIARTEIMRSWRGAQFANYRANSDVVKAWQWAADFGPRCCGSCMALDGSIHPLDEQLEEHPCGRCAALPVTASYSDLLAGTGADASALAAADELEGAAFPVHESGEAWLSKQEPTIQNRILGPAKAEAFRRGDLRLSDLISVRHDPVWGSSVEERSLRSLGLDAQKYLALARGNGTASSLVDAAGLARAAEGTPQRALSAWERQRAEMIARAEAAGTQVARPSEWEMERQRLIDLANGAPPPETEGFALKEPPTGPTLTREALVDKSMADLRQIARDLGVTPARSKAETIDRILTAQPATATRVTETSVTDVERAAALRSKVDDAMITRDALYEQQYDLVAQRDQLLNDQNNAAGILERGELAAKRDLYHQSLDQSDPEVRRYLKNLKAYEKAQADSAAARASGVGADKAAADLQRAYTRFWSQGVGVYKPELDTITGFENYLAQHGLTFSAQEIAANRFMVAAEERVANIPARLAEVDKQIATLDKSINRANKQIERDLTTLGKLRVALDLPAQAADTLRPFSDVINLPEGHQPANRLMQKMDYTMREPRRITKSRIIDDLNTRLKNNPDWQEYVARTPMPDRLGVYHGYIDWHAAPGDSKSAALVADWIKRWGVGYRPGSTEWMAMQMAARDEFGLDAGIHSVATRQAVSLLSPTVAHDLADLPVESFYAENGAAIRALMRAMYDNTQQWFADNNITEIEVFRGMGWQEDSPVVPRGINWGPVENPNYGVGEVELNPFQSFSADINVSQGTGVGNGFAGGGFGGGDAYSLLIGAKVPVERVLATAQTGFGAKLESEIVVMGRATDSVSYRAGTRVDTALLRQADEVAVSEREVVYSLGDGGQVRIVANEDGTFTITNEGVPQIPGGVRQVPAFGGGTTFAMVQGSMKPGASRTFKTVESVNKALTKMRIANTYVAPDLTSLALRESEDVALSAASGAAGGASDGLTTLVDNIPADVISVPDIQDWVRTQLPDIQEVDLMALDAPTARLVANASANLMQALPDVQAGLWRIIARNDYSGAIAFVPRDGLSLILNTEKWSDLAGLASRAPGYVESGWWVTGTPEQIIGHEIGHMLQIRYDIGNDTWLAALDRVAAAGGNPLVSQYAGDKIEESFAETFALLVYGQPTEAQLPIAREMVSLLRAKGLDYTTLRAAVGAPPLSLGD